MKSDLRALVGANEKILWQGRPNKTCFILESIFNPMLPIAAIWALLDFSIIGGVMGDFGVGDAQFESFSLFILGFFALHLMPVWIYLGGVLMSVRRFKNTEYIITDKGLYISGGTFSYTYEMKPFTDLSHINIHRGIFDQWLGVGDVVSECHHITVSRNSRNAHSKSANICNISDYQKVFALVKKLQTDIYADTMYPNDLRPAQNHGYNTEYISNDGE